MGYQRNDNVDAIQDTEQPQYEENEYHQDCDYHGAQSTLWLDDATEALLDLEEYPLGTLTRSDMEIMGDLLATWPRRRTVQAAMVVEKLLKRIVDEKMHVNTNSNNSANAPMMETKWYAYAMEAWGKSGAPGAPERAQSIHTALVQNWKDTGQLSPTTESYNTLLAAWRYHSPQHVEEVFKEMLELYRDGGLECVKPDTTTFTILLETYLRDLSTGMDQLHNIAQDTTVFSYNMRIVERCEELVALMTKLGVQDASAAVLSTLQSIYSRSSLDDSVKKTERVLQRLRKRHDNGDALAKPNAQHYNAILAALSRQPTQENAKKACNLLRQMELSVQDGGLDVKPDRMSYGFTILACGRCPDVDFAANMSENVLLKMEQRAKLEEEERKKVSSAAPPSVRLDLESFNIVLMALSRSRHTDAPERAEQIIERLQSYPDIWGESLRPSIRTWNALLHCYARASSFRNGNLYAEKAENLLRDILEMNRNGTSKVRPDAYTYSGILSVYQRSSDPAAAKRADEIVREMEELYKRGEIDSPPDTFHYTILCRTYARSGGKDAPSRVLQILSHMVKLSNSGYSGASPNTRTFNTVLDCLEKAGEAERAEKILYYMVDLSRSGKTEAGPDSYSFRSVVRSFAKSKERGSAKRAEQVLDFFLQYYEEENQAVCPDTKCFKPIIERYCESGDPDSPYRAEYLLNRMVARFRDGQRFLEPPLYCFCSVIKSYAYAAHPDAGRNAERLLKTVRNLILEGAQYLVVNTALLNSVLLAYSTCKDENAGQKAEIYLNDMEVAFKNGDCDLQPTSRSYCLVLSAWSKSTYSFKFRRALSVLRRMERQEKSGNNLVEVDAYALGLVINACGFSNDGVEVELEAFSVAVKVFNTMIQNQRYNPSSLCYGWFIECMGRLRVKQEAKDAQIKRAFKHCREAGMVDPFVLQKLRTATSLELSEELLTVNQKSNGDKGSSALRLSSLPGRWTRNVSQKSKRQ